MTSAFTVNALGVDVTVLVADDDIRDRSALLWADCGPPAGDGVAPKCTVVMAGTGPWEITSPALNLRTTDRSIALSNLCAAINSSAVAMTPLLAVHAAVVTRAGVTLVIPGASGAGKTTLTAAFLRAGWDYASDEALLLAWAWDGGPLMAYPRPLALSDWSAGMLGVTTGEQGAAERFVRAAQLGGAVCTSPSRPAHLLLLRRDASGGEAPALHEEHASLGLHALLLRGFSHFRRPEQALQLLGKVARGCNVWTVDVADPMLTAAHVGERLVG